MDDRHKTLLLIDWIFYKVDLLNFRGPAEDGKVLKIMISDSFVSLAIFAEVVGSFEEIEVAVILSHDFRLEFILNWVNILFYRKFREIKEVCFHL